MKSNQYWRAWQLIDGCTPCSPGCTHCWSAAMTHRFKRQSEQETFETGTAPLTDSSGSFTGRIIIHPERLDIPLRRKKPTVYAIWNDLFHKAVPVNFQNEVYRVMATAYQHTFLILTKRPQKMLERLSLNPGRIDKEKIYHGLTVCNQQEADEKMPEFLDVPGKKWLSIEPCLSSVDLYLNEKKVDCGGCSATPVRGQPYFPGHYVPEIDFIVVGCETGIHHRPCKQAWIWSIIQQCNAAGILCFVKQIEINGRTSHNPEEWPASLRVRQTPW